MADTFEITGAKELQVLAGDLAKVPVAARAQLRARMRAVGTPMKTAVQRNALAIPASGETSTGLRHAIAAATKVRTTVTPDTVAVKVYVDPSAMPPGPWLWEMVHDGRAVRRLRPRVSDRRRAVSHGRGIAEGHALRICRPGEAHKGRRIRHRRGLRTDLGLPSGLRSQS
jgi:hypothetical protein